MKVASILLGVFFLFACQAETNSAVENVNAGKFYEALQKKDNNILLVDVRTSAEYASGHIEGSILKDVSSPGFEKSFADIPKEKAIYVYCRSGARSGRAAGILAKQGFQKIVNMEDGIISWQQNSFPVVR